MRQFSKISVRETQVRSTMSCPGFAAQQLPTTYWRHVLGCVKICICNVSVLVHLHLSTGYSFTGNNFVNQKISSSDIAPFIRKGRAIYILFTIEDIRHELVSFWKISVLFKFRI